MEKQRLIFERDNKSNIVVYVDDREIKNVVSINKEENKVKYIESSSLFPYWPSVIIGSIRIERKNDG